MGGRGRAMHVSLVHARAWGARRWALTEPERLHCRLRVTEPERSIDPLLLTEPDRAIPLLLLLTEADRCSLWMNSERCWGISMNSSQ